MLRQLDRLAGRDPAALFVKTDGEDRTHDHEAGKGGKQDVVPAEREKADDDRERNDEDAEAVERGSQAG